ncbi:MAG: hypothetical protein R2789_08330 [Microthrixaceae bacterium]
MLDAAEDIVNEAAPSVMADLDAQQRNRRSGWRRFIPFGRRGT